MHFDLVGESVNKFNQVTLQELQEALGAIRHALDTSVSSDNSKKIPQGLLITSGKPTFVVGADITEFADFFAQPRAIFIEKNIAINRTFSILEDLPIPSVALINGIAFGGGFEICLAADFRLMSQSATVALPEVKLGLIPGWGGQCAYHA